MTDKHLIPPETAADAQKILQKEFGDRYPELEGFEDELADLMIALVKGAREAAEIAIESKTLDPIFQHVHRAATTMRSVAAFRQLQRHHPHVLKDNNREPHVDALITEAVADLDEAMKHDSRIPF